MRRALFGVVLLAVSMATAYPSARADISEGTGYRPALCIIEGRDGESLSGAREALAARHVRALHIFPPNLIFGRFPSDFDAEALAGQRIAMVWSADDVASKVADPLAARVIRALFRGEKVPLDRTVTPALPMNDLLLEVPDAVRGDHVSRPDPTGAPSALLERGMHQNSEFMIGTILVNVVFPESDGGSEDWTDDELAGAMSAVAIAMSQYQRDAPLSGSLRLDFLYNYYTRVPVSIEPIEGNRTSDAIWIGEVMQFLGYEKDQWETHTLNNDTRVQFGADWVFTAYVVDASVNGCWQGGVGYYAYGHLGGPFMVIPYPTCSWTSLEGFAHIFIHEASHIFWSLDEYSGARFVCEDSSGYLRVPTRNTYYMPCEDSLRQCIMNNWPLAFPLPVCAYTLGQLGLADADGDTIPDIYQVPPTWGDVDVQRVLGDTIYDDLFVVKATCTNAAVPNMNPYQHPETRIDYAPWLIRGTYHIGAGPEHEVLPVDGVWDESSEELDFLVSGFAPQENDLWLTVRNCAGLERIVQKKVYYVGVLLQSFSVHSEESGIELSWRLAQASDRMTFLIQRSEGTGGEYRAIPSSGITRNGLSFAITDTDCERGIEYRYRVWVDDPTEPRVLFETGVARLPALALRLYQNYPNPFNPSTEFRFSLPEGCEVTLDVFDINGRFVARLVEGYRKSGFHTVMWDGRDSAGREVCSGVYFSKLRASNIIRSAKIVIAR